MMRFSVAAFSAFLCLSVFSDPFVYESPAEALRTDKWGYVWQNPVYRFRLVTTNHTSNVDYETLTGQFYTNTVRHITIVNDQTVDPPSFTGTTNETVRVVERPEREWETLATNTTWTTIDAISRIWEDTRIFGTAVNETNTPGNVYCTVRRMKAAQPFYYAFLDGFDTRALAKAGGGIVTNDADGNAILVLDQWGVANTAATVRAVFLADL